MNVFGDPNIKIDEAVRTHLHTAFNAVRDLSNWKLPVDRVIPRSDVEALGYRGHNGVFWIRSAVVFFTGSVPQIEELPSGDYAVSYDGYYVAVGA